MISDDIKCDDKKPVILTSYSKYEVLIELLGHIKTMGFIAHIYEKQICECIDNNKIELAKSQLKELVLTLDNTYIQALKNMNIYETDSNTNKAEDKVVDT